MPLTRLTVGTILVLALLLTGSAPVFAATTTEQQRETFKRVYPDVERGNWGAIEALDPDERSALEDYVLYPDLRAAWFRATLRRADHNDIEDYLASYGALKPARELRYRYALHLADIGHLDEYLAIYEQFYQGLDDARLDCLALEAELEAGRESRVVNRAIELWTIGRSQVNECDPVFEFLNDANHLELVDYMRRFELAIDAREFSIARWLGKSIDQAHIDTASRWLQAQRSPESFVAKAGTLDNDESTRAQLVYAIERITYSDPLRALELWKELSRGQRFSAEQELRTSRHIALWMARDGLPGAYEQLADLPVAARNAEVQRWLARTSLRLKDWSTLVTDIEAMSAEERASEEWQYWYGIGLRRLDREADGDAILQELAEQRSYYGFLAADELGLPYSLADEALVADEQRIAELEKRPELIRARELFLVGLDSRGRSEWDAAVRPLAEEDKRQAAIIADRWGWHSRAIAASASAGELDNLSLRYPLPFHQVFEEHSSTAGIATTWAYGVARSESLFMRDVRSSAGAIGLMQLMPATGKQVARSIKLPYSGLTTLTNPSSNIQLGTSYLGQMAERYGGNHVLATAAYNAGPHRVDTWLPEVGAVDARVWIENIPFNETRSYVKRVLAAQTIFHWRMTGDVRRLSDELPAVSADSRTPQIAGN